MLRFPLLPLVAFLCLAISTRGDDLSINPAKAGAATPWNHLEFHNGPEVFQFAIVGDNTGGARRGVFASALRKLNLLQPEFVMSIGDLIEGYTEDADAVNAEWDEFQGFVAQLEMPFFYVAGNHDYTNPAMARIWEERFGRSYYSFVYRNVLILCLNSQEPAIHHVGEAQREWIRETLAAHPDVSWTLVFLHTPLWEYPAERGWPEIETALGDRPYTVFTGHYHTYLKHRQNDAHHYILATTGGGSELRGAAYGEFDHVVWVTMTAKGPRLANLMLDGIHDDNLRTPRSKELADAFTAGGFATGILWLQDGKPAAESVTLQVTNPTSLPADIRLRLDANEGIAARLEPGLPTTHDGYSRFTLPAGSKQVFNLQIAGDTSAHSHQARAAARLIWEAALEPSDAPPVRIDSSLIIPLVPRLTFPLLGQPLIIDGDATDWPADLVLSATENAYLHAQSLGWNGPEDCRFQVGFARDETHLYLLVAVTDDEVVSRADIKPWRQDGLEIRFDFREPAAQATARASDYDISTFIGSSPAPGDGLDPAYLFNPSGLPAGTKVCNRITTDGYVFEAAIPLAALIARHGERWMAEGVRINIAVNDRDGDEQAQLWWQPDWRTAENIPASGTFFLKPQP